MPNPIFRTVSFRRPTELQNALPITLLQSAKKDDAEETTKKLKIVATAGGERPSNDELLGYLAARMGEKRSVPTEELVRYARRGDRAAATSILFSLWREVRDTPEFLGAWPALREFVLEALDQARQTGDLNAALGMKGARPTAAPKREARRWPGTKVEATVSSTARTP